MGYTSEPNYRREVQKKVIYDLLELPRPQVALEEKHSSKRKR